jgi:hypothetical protein
MAIYCVAEAVEWAANKMSRIFTGSTVPSAPYAGLYQFIGAGPTANTGWMPITIPWAFYGVNTIINTKAIAVDLRSQTQKGFDRIRTVRIDNLGVNTPVYVYFPDTLYTVACPPNTIVQENVISLSLQPLIVGEGFTNQAPGTTTIFFGNFNVANFFDPEINYSQDLWLATQSIGRAGNIQNQNFGTPALGDSTLNAQIQLDTVGNFVVLDFSNAPVNQGYVYISYIAAAFHVAAGNNTNTTMAVQLLQQNAILLPPIWTWQAFDGLPNWNGVYDIVFPPITGVNIKLNNADSFKIQYALGPAFPSALFIVNIVYTANPI